LLKIGFQVVEIIMKIVIKPERQDDPVSLLGDDLGATAEAGEEMADVAVVPLDVVSVRTLAGFSMGHSVDFVSRWLAASLFHFCASTAS
jgi:hypothetical protein